LCVFERLSRVGAVCVVADFLCSGIIACLNIQRSSTKYFALDKKFNIQNS